MLLRVTIDPEIYATNKKKYEKENYRNRKEKAQVWAKFNFNDVVMKWTSIFTSPFIMYVITYPYRD